MSITGSVTATLNETSRQITLSNPDPSSLLANSTRINVQREGATITVTVAGISSSSIVKDVKFHKISGIFETANVFSFKLKDKKTFEITDNGKQGTYSFSLGVQQGTNTELTWYDPEIYNQGG